MVNSSLVAEFLEHGGLKCPFCGAEEVIPGAEEYTFGTVKNTAQCDECEAQWVETYTLSDFYPLSLGNNAELFEIVRRTKKET